MSSYEDFKWFLNRIYVAITHKNLCKTCIVRACCTEKCKRVIRFEIQYWPYRDSLFMRFYVWSIIFEVFAILLALITIIIKRI